MGAKAQSIREKIISVADDLFYRHGYNRTSFSDISAAVGISRGNFYYHFKAKDDILAAVIENRIAIITNVLQEWDQQSHSPRDRLFSYVTMMESLKDDIHRYGCPVGSVCSELIKLRNIYHSNATEMILLFRDWMVIQFSNLHYDEQKSKQLAMHLLSRTQGISMMSHAFADDEFLLREMQQLKHWIEAL